MLRREVAVTRAVIATLAVSVALAGCTAGSRTDRTPSSQPQTGVASPTDPPDRGRDLQFAVVTNGAPGDPFWDVVQTGADEAGTSSDVDVDYQSDPDPGGQAQLIDAAISTDIDGLVVSLGDPDALRESVLRATAAGVPVITINSGSDRSAEFGALTHVGQSDLGAGRGAAEQLRAAGVTTLLCVIPESGDPTLEERCRGAAEGFGVEEGVSSPVISLPVNGANLSEAETTIVTELQTTPAIDGILTLNAPLATAALRAVGTAGSQATIATFELNPDVVQAITDGELLFAVDQQQYLQGYLPVVFLALYARTGTIAGAGQPVLTGPEYITRDNVDTVGNLAMTGTR